MSVVLTALSVAGLMAKDLWTGFTSRFGMAGVMLLGLIVFYEGIPGANYVTPYLRFVPAAGPLVDDIAQGRVGRAKRAAAAGERAAWQEAIAKLKDKIEADRKAAQAKIDSADRALFDAKAELAVMKAEGDAALAAEGTDHADKADDRGGDAYHPMSDRLWNVFGKTR